MAERSLFRRIRMKLESSDTRADREAREFSKQMLLDIQSGELAPDQAFDQILEVGEKDPWKSVAVSWYTMFGASSLGLER